MTSSNKWAAIWLACLALLVAASFGLVHSFSVDGNSSIAVQASLAYAPDSSFDTDNDGIETQSGVIDFTLEDSLFNATPDESALCSLWHVYSQDTSQSIAYCQGSQDCCIIAQALSPVNLTYIPSVSWERFYLSYDQDSISTASNIVKAQLWTANSTNITQAGFSDWQNLSAQFLAQSQLSVSSSSPADGVWLNRTGIVFNASVSSTLPLANCTIRTNASQSTTLQNPPAGALLALLTLPDGDYAWNATCTDTSAASASSTASILHIDSQPPSLTLIGPANNTVTNQSFVLLSLYPTDSRNRLTCSVKTDETNSSLGEVILNNTPYAYNATLLSGTHVIRARCTDSAGNLAESESLTITYTPVPLPPQPGASSISFTKPTVDLREPITASVQANGSGPLTLTIRRFDLLNRATLETYYTLPSPAVFTFNDTYFEGQYTFMLTGASIRPVNATALVNNNISANINRFPEIPIQDHELILNANVSGGTPPYQHIWNFNGTTFIAPQVSRSPDAGNYQVSLIIKDALGNNKTFSRTITVYNEIKFLLKDRKTGLPIQGATVTMDGTTRLSNESGLVAFYELDGIYTYSVSHFNYTSFTQTTSLQTSETRPVDLDSLTIDTQNPSITSLSPEDGSSVEPPLVVTALVSDDYGANCSLYTSRDASLWTFAESVATDSSESITLSASLGAGSAFYRVECRDASGRTNVTPVRSINVNVPFEGISTEVSKEVRQSDDEIGEQIEEIDTQIDVFNKFDRTQRELAEALDIYRTLDESKALFVAARRNISDARFDKLSDSELEGRVSSVGSAIQEAKRRIPLSFNVLDSSESIVYATNQDIAALADDLVLASGKKLDSGQKQAYVKQLQEVQGKLGVTALYGIVEITYMDTRTQRYGVVVKTLTLDGASSSSTIIESIPKTVAASAGSIHSTSLFAIVKDDPVLRFSIPADNKIKYYVNDVKSIDDLGRTKTILMAEPSGSAARSSGGVTGFAILPTSSNGQIDWETSGKFTLIIAIVGMLVFYLLFSLNIAEYVLPNSKQRQAKERELLGLLESANTALNNKSSEEAALRYTELGMLFDSLGPLDQERHYPHLEALANRINLSFAEKTLEQIEQAVHYGAYDEAHGIYPALNEAYEKLTAEHKATISERCMKIFNTLSEH